MRVLWWRGGGMDTLILDSSVWHMGSHRISYLVGIEYDRRRSMIELWGLYTDA